MMQDEEGEKGRQEERKGLGVEKPSHLPVCTGVSVIIAASL